MTIRIEARARLHLGMIDLHGGLGRKFGSIGVVLQHPKVLVEASPSSELIIDGQDQKRAEAFARRFFQRYALASGAHLRIAETIPAHVGLGSGTQLALAVGTAVAKLHNLDVGIPELAELMGRGKWSGIGIGAFRYGGFLVDGGCRIESMRGKRLSSVPPIIFRCPFPEAWTFVIAIPEAKVGLSGKLEEEAFDSLSPLPPEYVGKICWLLVMKMLPSLMERDITGFGESLTEIQRLVGDSFAAAQGGRYASNLSAEIITYMLQCGVKGAGQSSWGPTVYGLVESEAQAIVLERRVIEFIEERGKARVFRARANNRERNKWR